MANECAAEPFCYLLLICECIDGIFLRATEFESNSTVDALHSNWILLFVYMYGDLREGEMNQNHGYVHIDIQSTADFVTSYHHIIYTISKYTYPVDMDLLPTQMMISIAKILKRITNTFFSIFAGNEKKR